MRRACSYITCIVLALIAPLGVAQGQGGGLSSLLGTAPTKRVNADSIVFHGIERTPAQRDAIEAIRHEFNSRVQKLNGERRADYWERFLDLREWQIAAMRRVLTPEQQKVFDRTSEFWRESDAKLTSRTQARRDSLTERQAPE
jgi:Spy/CpxP family protein refolding chaperone